MKQAPGNNVFYRNQNWSYPRITHGKGIHLFDDSGHSYIDACSGAAVANIGHGNKEIAAYAREHIERIAYTHLSRWTVDSIENCAEKLSSWTPSSLDHVYFVSGGSEAIETALKMARQYFVERNGIDSKKWKIISKWNAYHGSTLGALSLTGVWGRRRPYGPILNAGFPQIQQFYHYRNPWNCKTLEETSIKAAQVLEEEILNQDPDTVSAFITEPIVGAAAPGAHPTKIYFDMVREICDKYDILLIIDEVMSGIGRTGKKFGSDHYDVKADIMTLAKGLSCGYTPIGAAVASDRVFETIMLKGSGVFVHGYTFAGNPLSCGIAHKVLEIIEREGYVENSAIQGEYLISKLKSLADNPVIGDIRGKGLMIGVELVKNKETKEPFDASINASQLVMEIGLEEGIVLYPGGESAPGNLGDHFLLAPPINITREEIDMLFYRLEKTMNRCVEKLEQFCQ